MSRFVYVTGVNVPDYLVRPGAGRDSTYRIVRDHLGSVRVVVHVASGTIIQRIAYDEFGVETENTNPGWQPFGYAGGLSDSQTGLVRFGARDYDPASGRWTAKDPIGFAGGATSLYAYVGNDPANRVDPLGLSDGDSFWNGVGQFLVGLGDGISFGGTRLLRSADFYGGDSFTDPCATIYKVGVGAGVATTISLAWAAGLNGGAQSVIWMGRGAGGIGATMGTTIAQTPIGALLVQLGVQSRAIWAVASATFAANASGTVNSVITHISAESLWHLERFILDLRGIFVRSHFRF